MHTILRPREVDGGLVRLNAVSFDGHLYTDRVLGADIYLDSGIGEVYVEFLTETPVVYAVAKGQSDPRPQPGFVPSEDALLSAEFDCHRLVHPAAEGWRVAQETASPFVSMGMWEHCTDCAEPAMHRMPWLDLGGHRFTDIVSVSFRRSLSASPARVTPHYSNGHGRLLRGTPWVARVRVLGTVAIEPV